MKLDPAVFLVAPDPEPPPVRPTRRVFCAGLLAGVAAGAGLAVVALRPRPAGPAPRTPPDDERLRWALALQDGDLDGLVRANTDFLLVFTERADARDRLEPGVTRLATAVLEDDPTIVDQRALLAAKLAQTIDALPSSSPLRRYLAPLRRVNR